MEQGPAAQHDDVFDPVDETRQPGHSWFTRLYTGTGAADIVGRRRVYFAIVVVLVVISALGIALRGFTLSIEFQGGSQISFPTVTGVSTTEVAQVYRDTLGSSPVSVQTVGSGSAASFQIRSQALSTDRAGRLQAALYNAFHPRDSHGVETADAISSSDVSATWGRQITHKAAIALVVFLVLVSVYIAVRYERDMAIAALASLIVNMVVTAGIYSIVGFELSPETVIGLLTILGFSLYDSVVVFDKVEENTRGILQGNRRTYAEQANLAVNQTLMRSINTTLIGVLPIVSLIVVTVWLLGVGTLKDLALVQLIGMVVGACSSIFFATPLLVTLKQQWGPVAAHTRKVLAKREQAHSQVDRFEAASSGRTRAGRDPNPASRASGAEYRRGHKNGSAPRPGARSSRKRRR